MLTLNYDKTKVTQLNSVKTNYKNLIEKDLPIGIAGKFLVELLDCYKAREGGEDILDKMGWVYGEYSESEHESEPESDSEAE